MRRAALLAALVAAVAAAALGQPGGADAHPLGDFTVNHYAGIELAGSRVYVRFVLDLAEIPAFQEGGRVRAPGYAAAVARELELRLDGTRVRLTPMTHRVSSRPGAGGLPTLRFEAVYRAARSGTNLEFADRTFRSRIGWREITVAARDGARLVASSVPATSRSGELQAYPQELLTSPLDVRSATARLTPAGAPGAPPQLDDRAAPVHRGGGFEALVARGRLSLGVVVVSLLVAAFWGAAHALTPGHGKALVAGYLIGTRGRPRDAVLLGATVTVTHTAGVFGLGLVTLLLSRFIVPEQLYPWLTLVSGLLVVGVGLGVLRSRLRASIPGVRLQSDTHDHHHHHGGARRQSDTGTSHSGGIVGVGIAAGLLPCPSALVVLLSAIALHRIGFGFALIVAFSLGLALTITGIGLVAVVARRAFSRVSLEGPVVRALPSLSAVVIVLVGLALTVRAIPGVV
ncbi:MAG TPA: sulfite exporter TauE/SafE family protein [Gaiella sp.]|nr:sulfite exporter TauE/SafE family protein [Gaiella sp.]